MTLAGKTVLVTGATGFLGGALVRRLAADGVKVRALARSPEKGTYISDLDAVEIVQGDITDGERMRTVAEGCEIVFHLAAAMGGPLDHQRRVNVAGTRHVVEAAAAARAQRMVHISTVAVYGYRHTADVSEDTAPTPTHDPYAITKAEGEAVVREMAAQHGLSYSIIRPGGIYGPRSNYWTGRFFRMAKRKPVISLGSGQGTLPVIYVDDLVNLIVVAATHPAAGGEAFNATSDPSPTLREYLGAYSQLTGHQRWLGLPVWPVRVIVRGRALVAKPHTRAKELPALVDLMTRRVNYKMAKARDLLGWQPSVTLEAGIQKCVPWLIEKGLLDSS